jgi:hypothetical protein
LHPSPPLPSPPLASPFTPSSSHRPHRPHTKRNRTVGRAARTSALPASLSRLRLPTRWRRSARAGGQHGHRSVLRYRALRNGAELLRNDRTSQRRFRASEKNRDSKSIPPPSLPPNRSRHRASERNAAAPSDPRVTASADRDRAAPPRASLRSRRGGKTRTHWRLSPSRAARPCAAPARARAPSSPIWLLLRDAVGGARGYDLKASTHAGPTRRREDCPDAETTGLSRC